MIRPWLRNPWETAVVAALAAAGAFTPVALAAAAGLFAVLEIVAGVRGAQGPRWWPSLWPRRDATLTILYDAGCALCVGSKARLEGWATAPAFRFLPLQSPDARALVPGLDEAAYGGAMHVVEDGKVFSGHEGWFRIMRFAPLPLALIAALTPAALAKPLYGWVARNRYRWFGRVCEDGSCRVHPRAKA